MNAVNAVKYGDMLFCRIFGTNNITGYGCQIMADWFYIFFTKSTFHSLFFLPLFIRGIKMEKMCEI